MKVRLSVERVKNAVTLSLMLVTMVLWGYLIGLYLAERSASESTMTLSQALQKSPSLVTNLPGRPFYHQFPSLLNNPPEVKESTNVDDSHQRFAERNDAFARRLKADQRYLLENSF